MVVKLDGWILLLEVQGAEVWIATLSVTLSPLYQPLYLLLYRHSMRHSIGTLSVTLSALYLSLYRHFINYFFWIGRIILNGLFFIVRSSGRGGVVWLLYEILCYSICYSVSHSNGSLSVTLTALYLSL